MSRNPQPKATEGDFTQDPAATKGYDFRQAATRWAGTMKETVRDNVVKAGYQTETYVRSHPGRFIAGACCLGLAAGWFISRTAKKQQ
jgi:ElaB/YqjD/DUF883 family membrane-anchored ribosome-binding protein